MTYGERIVKARDKFFKEKPNLLEGAATGEYLKNRLAEAFLAGAAAGADAERLLIIERLGGKKKK